ncbi:MAG TPA: hypothetical protein VFF68_02620 [Anaerolineaceae bacterium]|nr:hypothetical protein [Anaerolineaceae bacterium]
MSGSKKRSLNDRHKAIVAFIRMYRDRRGYSPSIAEIGAHIGVGSKSLVRYYLDRLESDGIIRRDPQIPRSIVLVRQ